MMKILLIGTGIIGATSMIYAFLQKNNIEVAKKQTLQTESKYSEPLIFTRPEEPILIAGIEENPIFTPKKTKLKGYQKQHHNKKYKKFKKR